MILIAGLGNPGEKFIKTRHNIGFLVLDKLQEGGDFADWAKNKTNICLCSWGTIANQKIELIKPITFMNDSGRAVAYASKKNNIDIQNIYIVHDDIDLPLGQIKISKTRGSAGHKGVESIIKALKTNDFFRFRIGIQPIKGKPKNVESFVIKSFGEAEENIIKESVKETTKAIIFSIQKGADKAMTEFN